MMKKVAIIQSCYIPWKGFFDLIGAVDEFILYDDMQYTRRDWRNRNRIKAPQGLHWLTVPVRVKGKYHQKIFETEIDGTAWALTHWKTLTHYYRRAPYFQPIAALLESYYLERTYTHLSDLNRALLQALCTILDIRTTITTSADYHLCEGKTERLVDLCVQAGASEYISGPGAQAYLDPGLFAAAHIKLVWFDYTGYPEYPQLWGAFEHTVTVLDLLFNCGPEARRYMKLGRVGCW